MTIRVRCDACSASFRVKAAHAGRRARCPQCQETINIPGPSRRPKDMQRMAKPRASRGRSDTTVPTGQAPESSSTADVPAELLSPRQVMRELLAAFQGDFPKVRTTIVYKMALAVVATAMLALPAIYVGLVALAGYGVYYHATVNLAIFKTFPSARVAVILYVVPLIVGTILVLFMIKPLLARPAKRGRSLKVKFSKEPILHSFVQRLCQAVNAPVPTALEVDCEVNASVGFRGGLMSMFRQEMVLTIGLPLVAGLNTRQMAGVLAHELGHVSQGAGMRLMYIIRWVNGWFVSAVYERDEWDELLADLRESGSLLLMLIGSAAGICVWLTRWVLWVLMWSARAIGCFLLRQMEFDADRYEIRLAGSDVFAQTTRRLHELALGASIAQHTLSQRLAMDPGGTNLPDNLPDLIALAAAGLPPELQAGIDRQIKTEKTGLLDTHPSSRDRVARARKENAPGIFHLERPATILFNQFDKLAGKATLKVHSRFYHALIERENLMPVEVYAALAGGPK